MNSERLKTLIVYNPLAGKNSTRPSPEEVMMLFDPSRYDCRLFKTELYSDAAEIVRLNSSDADVVVAVGGDGTFNGVAQGVFECGGKSAVAYLPTGSTNDVANALGIPSKLSDAVGLIDAGHISPLDVATVNDRFCVYIAGFGPGMAVSYTTPRSLKNRLGYSAYMLNGFVFSLAKNVAEVRPRKVRFVIDGEPLEGEFFFGAVSNSTGAGGMIKYDRNDVEFDDGKFELLLIKDLRNVFEVVPMIKRLLTHDYGGEKIIYRKVSSLTADFEEPENFTLDGEEYSGVTHLELQVRKQAIKLLSPGFGPEKGRGEGKKA
ncbi:MAG: YegS/Rv2252/BmrU family lipid kinase [Clostridia bacterium]|nr:YegS/Rv2252/BmrU family lipid kinase [Clostridia bacterium]